MAATPSKPSGGTRRSRGIAGWWNGLHPRARQQRLEMFIGILGFFTVAAFVTAVVAAVRGEPTVKEAFVCLLFGVPLLMVIRAWRRY